MDSGIQERKSTQMRRMKKSITRGAVLMFALLFLSALAAAAQTSQSQPGLTNIFAPETTPADSIFDLSMFVLAICGVIFVVVAGLLTYSIVKFRGRAADAGREPA